MKKRPPVSFPSIGVAAPLSPAQEIWGLVRPFAILVAIATAIGIISGLATAWLLATINSALNAQGPLTWDILVRFIALCAFSIGGSAVAGVTNSIVGQRMIASLRKEISRRVTQAPLPLIEQFRAPRILAILSNDVDIVSAFTFNFAGYAVSFAIVIGSLAYLASLSIAAFVLFLTAILSVAGLALYSKRGWAKDYGGVRDAQDQLQQQFRAITDGAKELRLNEDRGHQVHDIHLAGAVDTISRLKVSAMKRFWVVDSIGSGVMFIVIGALFLLRGRLGLESAAVTGAVLIMLYIRGPAEQILNGLPALFQAQVSFRRIASLSKGLAAKPEDVGLADPRFTAPAKSIKITDGVYEFEQPDGAVSFKLGPINLTIEAGKIIFIVGENGSGKTTLVKALLGLYPLKPGTLEFDDVIVEESELHTYRQMFSAVFSDYFLFADLVSVGDDIAERAQSYIEEFEIAHKVDVRDAAFSTIDLSTGQRKRLALIHAYLERRPIMMFDEWAADQDPTFRRIFYDRILPDLKAQGKTLIVVSHDDRFFHVADHVITLKDGKIVDESFPDKSSAPQQANILT